MNPAPRPIHFSPQIKLITAAILVALGVLLLHSVTHILPPFIAAIVTAYLFSPLVSLLNRRTRLPRWVWIIVLYITAFTLLYGLFTWVWPRIVQQSRDLASNAPALIAEIRGFFAGRERVEIGAGLAIDLAPLEDQAIGLVRDMGAWLSGNVPRLVVSAVELLIFVLVYLIVTFYLLLQGAQLKAWATGLIPAPYRAEIGDLGRQVDQIFSAYLRGQVVLIFVMAVLLYIPLSILQVPYALVIALASGTLEILPIIGPWSAAGIAMSVALFQPEVPFGLSNLTLVAIIGLVYFVLRFIEEHFIIPNVMGPLVKLHPAVVIFAILAGGAIAGPFGLFISIPAAGVARVVLRYLYQKLTDQPPTPPAPPPGDASRAEAAPEAPRAEAPRPLPQA